MLDSSLMRTAFEIEEDVLSAAKELPAPRRTTASKVLSDLAREGPAAVEHEPIVREGVPLLPPRPGSRPVTLEHVNRLRDSES